MQCENKRMRVVATGLLVIGLGMVAAAAAGCRQTSAPVPLDRLNSQQMRGHAVFQTRCAVCHNDRVDSPRNGPALVGVFQKPALHSGAAATDERVTATVMRGHGVMPAMGNVVDEQDMQDLLAYLHTL